MIDKLYYFKWLVKRCIDWDTRVIDVDKWFQTRQLMKVRLRWIDTPESYWKNASEAGRKVTEYVKKEYEWKEIIIRTHKLDKYWRYEWDIYMEIDGERKSINERLVWQSLAIYTKY